MGKETVLKKEREVKIPTLAQALGIILGSVAFIIIGIVVFKAPIYLMFLLSWLVVSAAGILLGHKYANLEESAIEFMKGSIQAVMIILAVGAMIAAFIASGTVPTIIYFGLKIVSPKIFLPLTLVVCSLTSVSTGTSWGTMGTTGLAMATIGMGMGMPVGLVAGAAVSGAYFGDKMSPISDTTICAAAISKTPLMDHVKHMLFTTTPAFIIAFILYTIVGLRYANQQLDYSRITLILGEIKGYFNIGFVALIPLIVLAVLLGIKKPAITSILISALVGAAVAVLYQGLSVKTVMGFMYNGHKIQNGSAFMNTIFNRGGVASMRDLVFMFLLAFGFSGMLRKIGALDVVINALLKKVNSVFKLVLTTALVDWSCLLTGSSISFALVVTGTLLRPAYKRFRLKPENLSRALEDFGTMGGPLIPYSANALFMGSVLGISPLVYIPYTFLNILVPIVSLIYAATGFTMKKYAEDEEIPED